MGIDGSPFCPYKTLPLPCSAGGIPHSFLIIPSCPAPLLGRDILTKLGASKTIPPHPPEPLASHSLLLASASHLAPPPPGSAPPTLPLPVNPLSGTPQSQLWLHTTRPSTFLLRTLTNTPADPNSLFQKLIAEA
jgi:hypothetical protein